MPERHVAKEGIVQQAGTPEESRGNHETNPMDTQSLALKHYSSLLKAVIESQSELEN